jgi:aspartate racemase
VGVLGGLGPEATVDFFAKVVGRTPASSDQEHLHLIIDNRPQVPNRNEAIAGTGSSPASMLSEMAQVLESAGADFLVMPCNAAHAFAGAIREAVSIPFVSIIEETRDEVVRRFPNAGVVGVLASTGCIDAMLYQRAFATVGVEVTVPIGTSRDSFMSLLHRIKAGDRSDEVQHTMGLLAERLVDQGAEVVIAGCTEVPLVLEGGKLSCPLIDSTDVLVERTIRYARAGIPG